MQTAIERDKLAKAKGRKDADEPILSAQEIPKPAAARQESTSPPPFKLFRNTSPSSRCEYSGTIVTPEGRVYAIEANVVEHDKGDGTQGKHFEGKLFGGQDLVRKMLKGAKVEGDLPPDMLTLLEEFPFDDSDQLNTDTGER
jgi:hypothetical protein